MHQDTVRTCMSGHNISIQQIEFARLHMSGWHSFDLCLRHEVLCVRLSIHERMT